MKSGALFLLAVLVTCLVHTGCVQSTGPAIASSTVTTGTIPEPVMPAPAAAPDTPAPAVTVVRYIPRMKDLKDPRLLFTLQVPAEWNVSTVRLTRSDTSDYRTDLVPGSVFTIYSSFLTRSREQEYRDLFRQWDPPPAESSAVINGIRYDRYESSAGGNTSVAYLPRSNSANERGYAGVLVFTARDRNQYEQEDFERVVSSFRYFSIQSAKATPGEVIPLYDLSGPAVSGSNGERVIPVTLVSGWGDTAEGVTTGGSGQTSSGGESHSSGCHH